MKLIIHNTSALVQLNGVPARIWEGKTDSGIPVICFVTRIAVANDADSSQFDNELEKHSPPSAAAQEFPLRMII